MYTTAPPNTQTSGSVPAAERSTTHMYHSGVRRTSTVTVHLLHICADKGRVLSLSLTTAPRRVSPPMGRSIKHPGIVSDGSASPHDTEPKTFAYQYRAPCATTMPFYGESEDGHYSTTSGQDIDDCCKNDTSLLTCKTSTTYHRGRCPYFGTSHDHDYCSGYDQNNSINSTMERTPLGLAVR